MRAAFYECDITPPLGCFLWGHYHEVRSENVKDRLYARAAVIEGEDGTVAAFVAVDACALPIGIHETVTKRIFEYTGILPENVCITATHTHWGAPVMDSPEIGCFKDEPYCDVFLRLTADAVILAYKRLDSADARYGTGRAEDIAFCRDYVLKDGRGVTWGVGANSENTLGRNAEPDPTVRVVFFERDGKPFGAFVNFACHQCCCVGSDYTGDYSSIVSKDLKRIYGEDFVSIYLPGAAGDITHVRDNKTPTTPDHYIKMGHVIADAVLEAGKDTKPITGDIKVAFETVSIQHRTPDLKEATKEIERLLNAYVGMVRARNLTHYYTRCKNEGDYALQAIRLGELCFYIMPGEVFIDLGRRVLNGSSYDYSIFVHNANTYCGYVPTKEAFREGFDLYETSLCLHSCLVPEAGEIMTDKLLELGEKIK